MKSIKSDTRLDDLGSFFLLRECCENEETSRETQFAGWNPNLVLLTSLLNKFVGLKGGAITPSALLEKNVYTANSCKFPMF